MIFKKHNKFKPHLSIENADERTAIPKEGGTAFIRLHCRTVLILKNCSGV